MMNDTRICMMHAEANLSSHFERKRKMRIKISFRMNLASKHRAFVCMKSLNSIAWCANENFIELISAGVENFALFLLSLLVMNFSYRLPRSSSSCWRYFGNQLLLFEPNCLLIVRQCLHVMMNDRSFKHFLNEYSREVSLYSSGEFYRCTSMT